jgi:hypothetical protein
MQPITIEAFAQGADAQAVCLAQVIPNDEVLDINGNSASGGIVDFPFPRRLVVRGTDAASEGIIITITGTDQAGAPQIEVFRILVQDTDYTGKLEFNTVTEVRANIGGIGTVQVGTSGIVGSNWARLDTWAIGPTIIQITSSGNANYTLQTTLDDPNSYLNPIDPDNVRWFPSTDTNVVNTTGNKQTTLAVNPVFIRLLVNSGTGTVQAIVQQTGGPTF